MRYKEGHLLIIKVNSSWRQRLQMCTNITSPKIHEAKVYKSQRKNKLIPKSW